MGKKGKKSGGIALPDFLVSLNRIAEEMGSSERFAVMTPAEGLREGVRQGILLEAGTDGATVVTSKHFGLTVTIRGGNIAQVVLIDTMSDQDGRFLVGVSMLCQALAKVSKDEAKSILYKLNLFGKASFGGQRVSIGARHAGYAGAVLSDNLAHLHFTLAES